MLPAGVTPLPTIASPLKGEGYIEGGWLLRQEHHHHAAAAVVGFPDHPLRLGLREDLLKVGLPQDMSLTHGSLLKVGIAHHGASAHHHPEQRPEVPFPRAVRVLGMADDVVLVIVEPSSDPSSCVEVKAIEAALDGSLAFALVLEDE